MQKDDSLHQSIQKIKKNIEENGTIDANYHPIENILEHLKTAYDKDLSELYALIESDALLKNRHDILDILIQEIPSHAYKLSAESLKELLTSFRTFLSEQWYDAFKLNEAICLAYKLINSTDGLISNLAYTFELDQERRLINTNRPNPDKEEYRTKKRVALESLIYTYNGAIEIMSTKQALENHTMIGTPYFTIYYRLASNLFYKTLDLYNEFFEPTRLKIKNNKLLLATAANYIAIATYSVNNTYSEVFVALNDINNNDTPEENRHLFSFFQALFTLSLLFSQSRDNIDPNLNEMLYLASQLLLRESDSYITLGENSSQDIKANHDLYTYSLSNFILACCQITPATPQIPVSNLDNNPNDTPNEYYEDKKKSTSPTP